MCCYQKANIADVCLSRTIVGADVSTNAEKPRGMNALVSSSYQPLPPKTLVTDSLVNPHWLVRMPILFLAQCSSKEAH